ncbi:MAG: DHH family phosphoesterase [Phycisphaerales bacterium]|nr:MAG: DHH family phosphoesterase [Phycisphaerales bacterium]
MTAADDFDKAIELIQKSTTVLVTTHNKPDGDACGCLAATCDTLAALGKRPMPLMLSPVPQWYEFLFSEMPTVLGRDIALEDLPAGQGGQADLIVIVDTNSRNQLAKLAKYLEHTAAPVLVIDHHATSDALGRVELTDPSASAAALILLDLLNRARWPVTPKIADALFVALATDTGWFRFSNTDARTLRAAAALIDAGAKPTELYAALYNTFSKPRFDLMLAMLASLELHFGARLATMHILQDDFRRTGAALADTENLINESHRISTVEIAALFVELKDGRIRCSLRSTGPVDVSKIAEKFGGGGHKMAAGTFLPGPLQNARQTLLAEIAPHMTAPDAPPQSGAQ